MPLVRLFPEDVSTFGTAPASFLKKKIQDVPSNSLLDLVVLRRRLYGISARVRVLRTGGVAIRTRPWCWKACTGRICVESARVAGVCTGRERDCVARHV